MYELCAAVLDPNYVGAVGGWREEGARAAYGALLGLQQRWPSCWGCVQEAWGLCECCVLAVWGWCGSSGFSDDLIFKVVLELDSFVWFIIGALCRLSGSSLCAFNSWP